MRAKFKGTLTSVFFSNATTIEKLQFPSNYMYNSIDCFPSFSENAKKSTYITRVIEFKEVSACVSYSVYPDET